MSKRPQRTTRPQVAEAPMTIHEGVLQQAIEEVRTKAEVHGDTRSSFNMIAELWSTYVRHAHIVHAESWITPKDVAQMMALLKIARSVYGDNNEDNDNYVDAAGYTALAALLGTNQSSPVDYEEE